MTGLYATIFARATFSSYRDDNFSLFRVLKINIKN